MKQKYSFLLVLLLTSVIVSSQQSSKLMLGGYGEVVFSRNFYSDNWKRFSNPELYKDDSGFGRVEVPHFVFFMSYDFGQGWKLGSEVEFEHGGVGSAVEIEEEETGEYESEIEKGGEVTLESMWLEKTFNKAFHIRMGHIVVPVGGTNPRHSPTTFFSNYRPEGEKILFPCTWHQTGISFWGKIKDWKYTAQLLPGLDAYLFDGKHWIAKAATSPFEFKIANTYAGMLRIDNYSIKNLQLGLSGYIGNSGMNSLKKDNYKNIKGTVNIIAFDFFYNSNDWRVRGSADYGHLTDSDKISVANKRNRKDSPSPKRNVGSDAVNLWVEAGYNIFSLSENEKLKNQKLFIFGRYNYYDSMYKTAKTILDDHRFERTCIGFGVNYFPIKQVVLKAEYNSRRFNKQFNNENSILFGVAFTGLFVK